MHALFLSSCPIDQPKPLANQSSASRCNLFFSFLSYLHRLSVLSFSSFWFYAVHALRAQPKYVAFALSRASFPVDQPKPPANQSPSPSAPPSTGASQPIVNSPLLVETIGYSLFGNAFGARDQCLLRKVLTEALTPALKVCASFFIILGK